MTEGETKINHKGRWKEFLPWTQPSYPRPSPSALFSTGLLASTHVLLVYPIYSSQSILKYKRHPFHLIPLLRTVQCFPISLRRASKVLYNLRHLVLTYLFLNFIYHSPCQFGLASSPFRKPTKPASHLRDFDLVLFTFLFQVFSEILSCQSFCSNVIFSQRPSLVP